jgi:hypothetical protein
MDAEMPLWEYNAALKGALALCEDLELSLTARRTLFEYAQALLDCYRVDDKRATLIQKTEEL